MSDEELSDGTEDILRSFWDSLVDDSREYNPDVVILSLVKTHDGVGTDESGVVIDEELKTTLDSFGDDFGTVDSADGQVYTDTMAVDSSESDVYSAQY